MVADLYEVLRFTATLVLYLLGGLFLAGVIITVERVVSLARARREIDRLREQVGRALGKGDVHSIQLKNLSRGFAGRVIAKALTNLGRTPEALNETVAAEVEMDRPMLERGLNFLGTMGANAPFIGLFGTVLGIMAAFHDMAAAAHAGPQVVMQGISEALVATAAGLLVAIPAVMAYNYLKTKVKLVLRQTEALFREVLAYSVDTFEFGRMMPGPGARDTDVAVKITGHPAVKAKR